MTARLLVGDMRQVLPGLPACSVDAVVTDPPYHLTSIVKRFGSATAAPLNNQDTKAGRNGPYERASRGFMGQTWDGGDVAFQPATWVEALRVLKPGGHLVAFGGTRTFHRLACAIEDSGFEIRDQLAWLYGSGFPKSHDVGKQLDRMAGARRPVLGRNERPEGWFTRGNGHRVTGPATEEAKQWDGWGTALKPACEPICLARKPLSESSVGANVMRWGTGALNVNACRGDPVGAADGLPDLGRWPANVVHDGSPDVLDGLPEAAARFFYSAKASPDERGAANGHPTVKPVALMAWLANLVTPPGGVILDPFAGSGSTGLAAQAGQFSFIGVEISPAYAAVALRRLQDDAGLFADVSMDRGAAA